RCPTKTTGSTETKPSEEEHVVMPPWANLPFDLHATTTAPLPQRRYRPPDGPLRLLQVQSMGTKRARQIDPIQSPPRISRRAALGVRPRR
ncbi:Os09g0464100, partial [Oryza sativa Japonica Group]